VTIEVLVADSKADIPGGRKTLHAPFSTRAAIAPLIVTSRGRTGTTLLMKWLLRHPDVVVADAYPYEIKLASYYASALKVLITPKISDSAADPDFVENATSLLQIGRNPWNSPILLRALGGHELQRLLEESVPDRLASLFRAIILDAYGAIRIAQSKIGAPFFAEKCMLDEDVGYGIRSIMGEVREIVMVRDPRGFLCSAKKFWHQDTERAMQVLNDAIPIYENAYRNRGADTLFVRYEDLIQTPQITLSSISDHFGIKYIDSVCEDAMLFSVHGTSLSPAQSIGQWKSDLERAEIERCEQLSSSFMETFGYHV